MYVISLLEGGTWSAITGWRRDIAVRYQEANWVDEYVGYGT